MASDPSVNRAVARAYATPQGAPPAQGPQEPSARPRAGAWAQALARSPEVRREKVAPAKHLVESPDYPPPETIAKIARLLAGHLAGPPG